MGGAVGPGVYLNTQCTLFQQMPQAAKRCVQIAIERAIQEMAPVLERSYVIKRGIIAEYSYAIYLTVPITQTLQSLLLLYGNTRADCKRLCV